MIPAGVLPVRDVTTREVLYGSRTTEFRYEVLSHDSSTGVDSLVGFLDGVEPGGAGLTWVANAAVKKSGHLSVRDLDAARDGTLRIRDLDLATARIRPVMVIDGLPEIALSVYVVTAAPENWSGTGRTIELELHDKSTVLDQDAVEETFTAPTGTPILTTIKQVIESAGETIIVDASDTTELANPRVWEAGTTKLRIVNDLLDVLGYNALWVDGAGDFKATKYVRPVNRPVQYTMLNDDAGNSLVRELSDGAESIYSPEWSRDRDKYRVPNKIIAVAQGSGDEEPLTGEATNEDPDSEFSYQARGRWIAYVMQGVDVPDLANDAAVEAYLSEKANQTLLAMSAIQAKVTVRCLPIPVELLDAVLFASTPAGINARHTVQRVEWQLRFDGLMLLDLLEVIDL